MYIEITYTCIALELSRLRQPLLNPVRYGTNQMNNFALSVNGYCQKTMIAVELQTHWIAETHF